MEIIAIANDYDKCRRRRRRRRSSPRLANINTHLTLPVRDKRDCTIDRHICSYEHARIDLRANSID